MTNGYYQMTEEEVTNTVYSTGTGEPMKWLPSEQSEEEEEE
jgi:hypothetical protein|tara:strand:+ start:32 stop:154 length:123 start_codon:yes stop_codon:yes gene_type:complete